MTEEQKSSINQKDNGSCCTFDGLPMHPHFNYFLTCAGFSTLREIEEITESEFIEIMDNAKTRSGKPVSHMQNLGKKMAEFLKKNGVIFR